MHHEQTKRNELSGPWEFRPAVDFLFPSVLRHWPLLNSFSSSTDGWARDISCDRIFEKGRRRRAPAYIQDPQDAVSTTNFDLDFSLSSSPATPWNTIQSPLPGTSSALLANIATMTSHEPSLLQARGGSHAHAHSAYKHRHAHGHDHLHHQYPHDAVSGPRPGNDKLDTDKLDTDQNPELKKRANVPAADEKSTDGTTPTATSLVTEVIQTVSLVQIVDAKGSPLSTLTQFAVPNTVVINKDTGKTISASNPDPTSAPAAPGSGPDLSKGVSSSPATSSQASANPIPSISASSPASFSSSAFSSSSPAASPLASSPASSPAPSPAPSLAPSMGIGHYNGTHSKLPFLQDREISPFVLPSACTRYVHVC